MYIFSKLHNWQNNPCVQQILVFPSIEVKKLHDTKFIAGTHTNGVEKTCDVGIGAIYKLKSIAVSKDKYLSVISCGTTGKPLWESKTTHDTSIDAIAEAITELMLSTQDSLKLQLKELSTISHSQPT